MSALTLPKVVLFDWDGTLSDSYAFLEGAHDHVLQVLGFPAKEAGWFEPYFGMSADLIYQHVYGDLGEKAQPLFVEYFYAHSGEAMQPIAGSEDVLCWFKEQGVLTAVVTNMRPPGIAQKLADFGWEQYFDATVGAHEATQNKPAPDPVYLALERCGYDGDMADVWFIGDTDADLAAAKAAGCQRFYLSKREPQSLMVAEYGPLQHIRNYADFLTLLREI